VSLKKPITVTDASAISPDGTQYIWARIDWSFTEPQELAADFQKWCEANRPPKEVQNDHG